MLVATGLGLRSLTPDSSTIRPFIRPLLFLSRTVDSSSPFAHSAIKNAGNNVSLHVTTTAFKYGSPKDWLTRLSLDLDV